MRTREKQRLKGVEWPQNKHFLFGPNKVWGNRRGGGGRLKETCVPGGLGKKKTVFNAS